MIKFPGCMRAEEYETWPAGVLEMAVEPKFDGYRLTVMIVGGHTEIYCRGDKPVEWGSNLSHIVEELLAMGFVDCLVDGEVMAEDWNKTGIVRSKNPSPEKLAEIRATVKFHAFDHVDLRQVVSQKVSRSTRLVEPTPLSDRRARLADFFRGAPAANTSVKMSEQFIVESDAELQAVTKRFLAEKFEGAMAKDLNAPYVMDKSSHWLKIKPTKTVEAEIVGVVEGGGKYVGMMGALSCKMADGTPVSVGGGFSDAQRTEFWQTRGGIIGKIVEVKMQDGESCAATARHPRFVRMRPDRTALVQ